MKYWFVVLLVTVCSVATAQQQEPEVIDTSKTDAKVLNFYIEECLKGSNMFRRDRNAMALLRTSSTARRNSCSGEGQQTKNS